MLLMIGLGTILVLDVSQDYIWVKSLVKHPYEVKKVSSSFLENSTVCSSVGE
jgi:hypothetical protein